MSLTKKIILFAGDIIILYFSLFLMLVVRYGWENAVAENGAAHLLPFSLIFVAWLIIFYLLDLYHPKKLRNRSVIVLSLLNAVIVSGIISIVAFYLFGGFFRLTPKTNLLLFALIFLIFDYSWRTSLIKFFASGALGVAVLGDSPLVEETVAFVSKNPQTGYRITGWIKKINDENLNGIENKIKSKEVQVIVTLQPRLNKEMFALLIRDILPLEVTFMSFWDFYGIIFDKVPLAELQESWFIENLAIRRPVYDALKRGLDFVLAIVLTLIFLPFALVIALIIKLTSNGPIIYKPERVGKNNSIITIYKFRTMKVLDEGPLWTEKNDSRVTPFGKVLRYTHLDEIPQLLNIIKGDISFTGPRPEHVRLAEQFRQFPYYDIRHIVKPGLTGWAQINYRPSASLEEAKVKLCYDLFYIKYRSFSIDLRIILKTIKYLFASHG